MASHTTDNGTKTENRLTYIEPNEFATLYNAKNSSNATPSELTWNPEDLAMSVDLQVVIPRREDKGQINYITQIKNATIHDNGSSTLARFISYMGGSKLTDNPDAKSFLTDNYTEIAFQTIENGQYVDSESLGINSIDINFDAHFFPLVTIQFTDVRGYSLFMPSELEYQKTLEGEGNKAMGSFFRALFHFPYPRFLLSVKGFYGNKVTFQLSVSDLRSDFQPDSGNYNVTVQFIGYVYGLYTDLPFNLVMAAPYYNNEYWENKKSDGVFKYVGSDGNAGNDILTYIEFLRKVEGKTVNEDALAESTDTKDFLVKKHKMQALERLLQLHRKMSQSAVTGSDVTKYNGDVFSFVWGKGVNKGTEFIFDDAISNQYYTEIRTYLKDFGYDTIFETNDFYINLAKNPQFNGVNITPKIIEDENNSYLGLFQTVQGKEIKDYFTFESGNTITNNTAFATACSGDEKILGECDGKDEKFAVGTQLNKVSDNGIGCGGLLINREGYCKVLNDRINEYKKEIKENESKITEDLSKVFENLIGFSPSVENMYRMLFAHIDCFMDFFNRKVLGDIDRSTKNGERNLSWLDVPREQLDIPQSMTGGNDINKDNIQVFPFPGYFEEKGNLNGTRLVAEFPGESLSERFSNIREVKAVKQIHQGLELLKEDFKQFLADDGSSANEGDNSGNTLISILSVLYNGVNPWDKLTIDGSKGEEYSLAKILYYFSYQVIAEKAIRMNIKEDDGDILVTDEYIDRQVDALLKSNISFSDTLIGKINEINNYPSDRRRGFLGAENYKDFKLYKDGLFAGGLDQNVVNIPLTLDGNIMLVENSAVTDEAYPLNNVIKAGNIKNYIGKEGELNVGNEISIEYEQLKKWIDNLAPINNALRYIYTETIYLGKWCVSLLVDDIPTYNCCDNLIPFVQYNLNRHFKITNSGCTCECDTYNEDNNIYHSLYNYYNSGVKNKTVYFVGRKKAGDETDPTGTYTLDNYTANNLFSGVKYVGGKEDKNNDDYKPLIDSDRCNTDKITGITQNEQYMLKKRAFAAYFLGTLCGPGSLGKTIELFKKGSIFTPVRDVELLYLGASLYFGTTNYSAWNKDSSNKQIAELILSGIDNSGELGTGLLGGKFNKKLQQVYDINYFLNGETLNNVGENLVKKFTNWCDNELFGEHGMYDKLAKTHDEETDEYCTLSGFANVSQANTIYNTKVQGYSKRGECAKWLTDLYYAYNFIYNVSAEKGKKLFVDVNKEVWNFLGKLSEKLKAKQTEKQEAEQVEEKSSESEDKLDEYRGTYYLLKNLYDKWLCSYTPDEFSLNSPSDDLKIRRQRFCLSGDDTNELNTTEYNNFVYVDQFYNDISSTYMMDIDKVAKSVKDVFSGNNNMDIYAFMSYLAEKNKLMLMALPVFNNMYNAKSIASVFTPNILYNISNYDNSNGFGTTYVVMYTSEVSHQPALYEGYDYNRDYVDIAYGSESHQEDLKFFNLTQNKTDNNLDYTVSAFAVSYGKQNQTYFKKVDVNMDNPKVTNESIRNTLILSEGGSQGDTNQPISIGQNIYSIYANRSYTCTVEMMGCANIMPLMYFQLNNIPMFRGLYMIINVRHSIKAGNMTTIFTGVRISRYSMPDLSRVLLNSNIFNKLDESGSWKDGKAVLACENAECQEKILDRELSTHFKLSQFTNSDKDKAKVKEKCNNENLTLNNPSETEIQNLTALCKNLLEPLYAAWQTESGGGFKVTSGFRSSCVNALVGSKETSDHRHGYAADLQDNGGDNKRFVKFVKCWLYNNGNVRDFKQFIDEKSGNSVWAHVSYQEGNNKKDFRKYRGGNSYPQQSLADVAKECTEQV